MNNYGEKVKQQILDYCKKYYKEYNIVKHKVDSSELDITHKQSKQKEKLIGTFQFVGELCEVELVELIVVEKYINLLFNKLKESVNVKGKNEIKLREQYIECLKCFIERVKKKLQETSFATIKKKCNFLLETKKFSKREEFMFMDILDLF